MDNMIKEYGSIDRLIISILHRLILYKSCVR
jgi:hypothetical protein